MHTDLISKPTPQAKVIQYVEILNLQSKARIDYLDTESATPVSGPSTTTLRTHSVSISRIRPTPSIEMVFLNPFKKYDLDDFPDVYIPLARAKRHPSVVAENKRRSSVATERTDNTAVDKEAHLDPVKPEDSSDANDTTFTVEQLRVEIDGDVASSGHDSAYDRKAKVINKAIQDIGMGKYQWQLFVLCGFGWLADNLWLQGVALSLNSLSQEFGISASNVRYTTLAT